MRYKTPCHLQWAKNGYDDYYMFLLLLKNIFHVVSLEFSFVKIWTSTFLLKNILDNFAVFVKQKPDFLEQNCVSLFDF